MSKSKRPTIAIMYDFDKTLCTKDMQEYMFIPNLGISARDFWRESNALAEDQGMYKILAYMYLMLQKAKEKKMPISRENFVTMGSEIEFYPGVESWFDRVNACAKEAGVNVEHYIISSGLREIIDGSKIKKKFTRIFACEFLYDENKVAVWPKIAVNYTAKTQFLFRINKGVLDVSNDNDLNKYTPDDERSIPFRNMIYIGDGLTDVPCMKLVKSNGGQSIAVFKKGEKAKVKELLRDRRVDFIVPADYSEGGELDILVKEIVSKMVIVDILVKKHRKQQSSIADK